MTWVEFFITERFWIHIRIFKTAYDKQSESEFSVDEIEGTVCKKYCPISEKGVCNRKTIIEQLSVL